MALGFHRISYGRSMLVRMFRAAKLDVDLYEEVEADKGATLQALLVVILTSIPLGLASLRAGDWKGLVIALVFGVISWAVWSYINYYIGTRWFSEPQTEADWGELARTLAFASTPRLLTIFDLAQIPVFSALVVEVGFVWWWVAQVIAVRQALDYTSTWRAMVVTLLGFLIHLAVMVSVIVPIGIFSPL